MSRGRTGRTIDDGTTPHERRARLVFPVAAAGLLVVCAWVLLRGEHETQTASEVTRKIRDIALGADAVDAPPEAGMLGVWRIAAERQDPATGALVNFRIRSGRMMIAARTARIVVDCERDQFSFEMTDVVYTRVPDDEEAPADAFVHRIERHVLGPIPYDVDIVPDGAGALDDILPGDAADPLIAGAEE